MASTSFVSTVEALVAHRDELFLKRIAEEYKLDLAELCAKFLDVPAPKEKKKRAIKVKLTADGKLGPATLAAMGYTRPKAAPTTTGVVTVDALIATAEHEADLQVREVGGMNRGAKVEEYQRAAALGPGDPWCAAFVAWCVMKSRQATTAPTWTSGSAITTWQKPNAEQIRGHKNGFGGENIRLAPVENHYTSITIIVIPIANTRMMPSDYIQEILALHPILARYSHTLHNYFGRGAILCTTNL